MANSREIVLILVGEAWEASAAMLKIISAAIFLSALFPLHSEMNKAIGHSRYFLVMEVAKKSIQVAFIVIGIFYGITGLLWALVFASFTDYVFSASSSVKFLGYTWKDQVQDIAPSALIAVAAVLLASLVDAQLDGYSDILALLVKGGLVTAVFLCAVLVFYKVFPEVTQMLRTAVRDHALRLG
jgi:O-antigen/teichoic acid export membrane protein